MADAIEFMTLQEIVARGRKNLPQGAWDYLVGATESETTMRRNRLALDCIAFRPRVLRDVSHIDPSGHLLGRKLRIPVLLAPIGSVESFTPGGGASSAKAAERAGVAHMLSSRCAPGLEEVAKAADNARIFQLYVRGDDDFVDDYARRAAANGYYAFCITIDSALYSRRERDLANRFVKPWRALATGTDHQAMFTWDNVRRFKDKHSIPLILKGIETAEEADKACAMGVEGIYVSNHGGRQLDQGPGTMDVLPEIVSAVNGRAAVIVDGGFCRGTDVLKAIATGADCVGLGRLQGWALAAGGIDGMVRALEILEDEIRIAMGLLGVDRLDKLDPSYLIPAEPVCEPHVASAFPHLSWDRDAY
ncbi:MAG: alpha-hydroxy acid oxidase [Alphaproteobacteria bacterium]